MSPGTLSYADTPDAGAARFAAPYLVLVLQGETPRVPPVRVSVAEVERVTIGRGAGRSWRRLADPSGGHTLAFEVACGWMSSSHAELGRDGDHWVLVDLGSKNGTHVNGVAIDRHALRDGDVFEAGGCLFLFRDRVERDPREPADVEGDLAPLSSLHPELAREFARARQFAASDLPLLVTGETGAGKEIAARALHRESRRAGAFVAVNCAAIPDALVEGELFGHTRGAFSGATGDRPGLIRSADGGTLFLDEIGELPLASQAKLLRVLQEGEVMPLGASRPVAVDVRVIAATHRDLPADVDADRFRADLLARLSGYRLALPPVRERREDFGALVAAVLDELGAPPDVQFERGAARALVACDWPQNVRQLVFALKSALTLAGGSRITLDMLPDAVRAAPAAPSGRERELRELLASHRGNVAAVARAMGKARVQIRRWCERYGIDIDSYREA